MVASGTAEAAGTRVSFRVPVPAPQPVHRRVPAAPAGQVEAVRVEAHVDGGGTRVALLGDLDMVGSAAVRDALRARLDGGRGGAVTVDLRGVGYLASAGVGLLLELRADLERRGTPVRLLVAAGSVPARVLAISGVPADTTP